MRLSEANRGAFQALKNELQQGIQLNTVELDRTFILRVDASDKAVGAALEQFVQPAKGMPNIVDATTLPTVPVAFISWKLASVQVRTWSSREKETYAVVMALQKWASYIGLQPVLILTDHKVLESWAKELLDVPS